MVSMSSKPQLADNRRPGPVPTASIDPETAWQQLLSRDSNAAFFYGVSTTGVFCRPGCSSRRPLKANVRFFRTANEAQTAGFRPCKRCRPTAAQGSPLDKIRAHIEANLDRSVPLSELGRLVNLSPFTVQRLFKHELGVSPLQYQRALRAGSLRGALKQGDNVTNAIYNAGFGSSSRAYEGAQLGMTPARFAAGGRGEQIGWASAPSPFGWVIVGATARGLCWLALAGTSAKAEASLRHALSLEPTNAVANLNLGMLLAELGKMTGAEQAFRVAFQADPQSALAAYNLGVLLAKEHPGESLDWCRRAAELGREDPKYGYTYAFYLDRAGRLDEALKNIRSVREHHPAHEDSLALEQLLLREQKSTGKKQQNPQS